MNMSGIGVNLRVTGHCNQGGRKYMEDMFSVAYQQTEDLKELEYAYFGIFDGHGGPEAAKYAKDHLIDAIVSQNNFWSDNDSDVLRAIHDGYINTHYAMYKQYETWPRTASGLPSTSGTTATIAFIRKGKLYIGHVGDSCIVLGYQEKGESTWKARPLTKDHKPECHGEINRIRESGGKVVSKSGVPRVVWNRPRLGHKGPVRRSTPIDEIPFLAVARALGDFWSYNSALDKFIVSPEPDVHVIHLNVEKDRCLILGTDGLWNMLSPETAVTLVQSTENHNERQILNAPGHLCMQYDKNWVNPSKSLVDRALKQWSCTKQRADNTSVVTLLLDRPGPPRTPVTTLVPKLPDNPLSTNCSDENGRINKLRKISMLVQCKSYVPYLPQTSGGVAIFTRYPVQSCQTVGAVLPSSSTTVTQNIIHQVPSNSPSVAKPIKTDCIEDASFEISDSNCSIINDNMNNSNSDIIVKSVDVPAEKDIQINEISSSYPDVEDTKEKHTSPSRSSSVKRKISNCHSNRSDDSVDDRLKLLIKRSPNNKDGNNSNIKNKESWSHSWPEAVCSNSAKNTIVANNHKRKKCSFEKKLSFNRICSCRKTTSYPCCDKARTNKTKLLFGTPTRMLRSDTLAITPIRNLRSRNINLSLLRKSKSVEMKPTRSIIPKSVNDISNPLKRSSTTPCIRNSDIKLLTTGRSTFSCPSRRLTRFTPVNHISVTTRTTTKKLVK